MRPLASRPLRIGALVALLAVFAACTGASAPDHASASGGRRVLFIGNSYLYSMGVPGIVEALARFHQDSIVVHMVAGADMALIDHWTQGDARRAIEAARWDWVVLQQGPSSLAANRDTLRMTTALFAGLIRAAHGEPALFAAWPSAARRQDFARAIESYAIAANDVGGVFLPVASAWLAAWDLEPSLQLYDDGLHPSAEGAYLAALVVYSRLFGRSPLGMPNELTREGGATIRIDAGTADLLQRAAAAALAAPMGTPGLDTIAR